MTKLVSTLVASVLASTAMAQACIDSNYATSLGSANDTVHPAQSIGHAFPFNGTTYTDVHISDHGVMWLSNAGVPTPPASGAVTYNVLLTDFNAFGPCISPLWADANCGYTAGNLGEVFINNSDPTKCVVTWSNILTYFDVPPAYTFQATLYNTGEIKFTYDANANNYGSTFAPNAIVGVTPGSFATLLGSSDLSTSPVTTDPSLYEDFAVSSTFDFSADGFRLIPTNPGWVTVPLGGQVGCAQALTYGTGCTQQDANIYEFLPAGTFDLTGQTITFLRGASGYTALDAIPGTFIAPSAGAATVALGDDFEETVALTSAMPIPGGTTTSLTVSSNGQITLGAVGNGADFTPSALTWLAYAAPQVSPMWHDFEPNAPGSGTISFEEVGGVAIVSWNGVYNWGTTTPETFQVQFDLASGNITIIYDAVSGNIGNDYLVGLKAGGAQADNGGYDLSAELTNIIEMADSEILPLALNSNTPILGNNWNLTTSNIDPVSPIAITFFATGQAPRLPFAGIGLNAPGGSICINTAIISLSAGNVGGSATVSIAIPNNPLLTGGVLTAQSLCLTTQNAANLLGSNGLQGTLGL